MSLNSSTRLNKYISESGICSRREADRYIEQGNVYINGRRAQVGDQVSIGDKVKVNGQEIDPREEDQLIFIALNHHSFNLSWREFLHVLTKVIAFLQLRRRNLALALPHLGNLIFSNRPTKIITISHTCFPHGLQFFLTIHTSIRGLDIDISIINRFLLCGCIQG